MKIFWQIYFWFLCLTFVFVYAKEGIGNIFDSADVFITAFALYGLFGYAYKKKLFNTVFWKIFLPVCISWDLLYNLLFWNELISGEVGPMLFAIALLFSVPVYVGLYLYSYRVNCYA